MTEISNKLRVLLNNLIKNRKTLQDLAQRKILDGGNRLKQNIVIDFSSPNIAKPFHYGHLKSTILGNFLANINKFVGNHVTKLNFIGDWGTQYGLLDLELGDQIDDSATELSLRFLLDVYIRANERAKVDGNFYEEAKRRFSLIEADPKHLKRWLQIRDLSVSELKRSYKKLGVEFDAYEFESEYVKESIELVKRIQGEDFIREQDGALVAQIQKNNKILDIPILKSDGSSLYITRDVAAAIDRMDKFKFDQLLYVAGANQEKHFHCLKEIVRKLGHDWHDRLMHVKMGKVIGLSSRSGGSEQLLSDIIDEATNQFIDITRQVPTTKVKDETEIEDVALHLALSALFVFDMRNARTRNYNFEWNSVMSPSERSGINLQTTFARLSSLLQKASDEGLKSCEHSEELELDAICCIEALNLVEELDEFPNELYDSYLKLDSKPLVDYALKLCKAINRARRSENLRVLGGSNERFARTRLTLFENSFSQLKLMIELIGLKPLHRV